MIPGYAALASVPYSYLGKWLGKSVMMFAGTCSFAAIGFIGWVVPKQTLINGHWGTMVAIYLIMGNGRAVFESTNRAVYADFFPETKEGAFAMLSFSNGIAGMIGFLVFAKFVGISPTLAAVLLFAIGAVALITVPLAFLWNNREKAERETRERLLEDSLTVT